MSKMPRFLFFVFFIAGITPAAIGAYELTGRVSSDLYAYQSTGEDHFRSYLRFNGNLLAWRADDGRSLRVVTSMRWTDDFADKLPNDPTLFVYETYAQLNGIPPRTDLYVGRMFVYNGAGSALLDGGKIYFRRNKNYNVQIFGGSSVRSEDPEKINSLVDDLVAGGRFGFRPDDNSSMGLNVMFKRREGHTDYLRAGIDAKHYLGPAEFFGRASFNAAFLRLAEVLARAAYRPGKWYFSGEYHWREPLVPGNSIFSMVDFDGYQIGRVEARRLVWRRLSVTGHAQADLAGSDKSWWTGLGFSTPYYSLSWIHKTGYGGDNDGVSGYLNQRLSDELECFASANLYRYRVQDEQVERSDAYASTVGLRWRAGWGLTVTAEGQYLRNAVLKDDGRLLLRIAKDFSVRGKKD